MKKAQVNDCILAIEKIKKDVMFFANRNLYGHTGNEKLMFSLNNVLAILLAVARGEYVKKEKVQTILKTLIENEFYGDCPEAGQYALEHAAEKIEKMKGKI